MINLEKQEKLRLSTLFQVFKGRIPDSEVTTSPGFPSRLLTIWIILATTDYNMTAQP